MERGNSHGCTAWENYAGTRFADRMVLPRGWPSIWTCWGMRWALQELEERESSVGAFSLDILARDQDSGEAVVIENQIEQSDHEHLGKLITYASGKDAKYIVWIVKDAREEHRAAIEWLNKISDDTIGFFNPLFRRVILLENTNKPARRIFDGQFCGLVSISFWH